MRRSLLQTPLPYLALFALWAGCTQDFDQFDPGDPAPTGGSPTTSTASAGGGGATSTSTASTGGGSTSSTATSMGGGTTSTSSGPGTCEGGESCFALPEGWLGPVALWEGGAEAPPACAGAFGEEAFTANRDLDGGANGFACAPCACGAPTADCAPAPLAMFDAPPACPDATPDVTTPQGAKDACFTIETPPGGSTGFSAAAAVTTNAKCSATGGEVQKQPPAWKRTARACALSAPGPCEGGACAPAPEAPFGAALCVYREGDHACPAGLEDRRVVYEAALDTRACSACACSPKGTVACQGTTQLFDSQQDCEAGADVKATVANGGTGPNACTSTAGVSHAKFTTTVSGECEKPTGGAKSGDVKEDPASALTICCE